MLFTQLTKLFVIFELVIFLIISVRFISDILFKILEIFLIIVIFNDTLIRGVIARRREEKSIKAICLM
nr:MAG: hypothetical protein TU35_03635 [Thermoproteus sp. AZ2]